MNKKVLWAVSALALGASVIVGSTLWAQGGTAPGGAPPAAPAPAAHPPEHKVAFINLAYVLKNSEKFNALMEEMKGLSQQYEAPLKAKQDQIERLKAEANDPKTAAAKREEDLNSVKTLTREIEDLTAQARKVLAPKNETNTVAMYRDIQEAAAAYAMSNGFEIVLQFQDGFTPEDYNSPVNILDKLRTRSCIPLYWQANNDISMPVVTNMNADYRKKNPNAVKPVSGTAPAPGTPGAPAAGTPGGH